MVNGSVAYALDDDVQQDIELAESPVKCCTVTLSDVVARGKRLEASVFDVESMQAYQMISNGKYPAIPLIGENSPVMRAYYGARLKRNYVDSAHTNAIGFVGSSEMLDCYPKPVKFMENSDRTQNLQVQYGDILISRSGTIGNLTFVGKTLSRLLVSEHAIRLKCRDYPGYVYAYLRSQIGQLLIHSNIYGAVIQEIEPEHLATVLIPDAPALIKKRINDLIVGSYELRDASNALIDEATAMLVKELKLPDIRDFNVALYKQSADVDTFSVKLSDMAGRADASYHVPIVDAIVAHMKQYAAEVTTVGDSRISKGVILPPRFARVYVEEEYGVKFIGGKEINQLDPSTEKYLSKRAHKELLEGALGIKPNSILTPARGSLGSVVMPCKHFWEWAISDNMMQILSTDDICGYTYIFLNSEYGKLLIRRFTYGGVIDAIEPEHIKQVQVPLLKDANVQRNINEMALAANQKRYEAYKLEQQALKLMDKEVIFAKK